jgi:hypothetical protein
MPGRCRILLSLCLVLAGGLLSKPAAAIDTYYLNLRFPPEQKPVLYCQISEIGLRFSPTPGGLKSAKAIRPASDKSENMGRGMSYRTVEFPEQTLPISLAGAPAVGATFSLNSYGGGTGGNISGAEAYVSARFKLTKKDSAGNKWEYLIDSGLPGNASKGLANSPVIDLPMLNKLQLKVTTEVTKKTVGVGLALTDNKIGIHEVTENGKPVACSLKILDAGNKPVASAKGNLAKFGFG